MAGYDGCEGTGYTRADVKRLKDVFAVLDAHGLFIEKMAGRIVQKGNEGFTGWATWPLEDLAERLIRNLAHGDFVDAANLAMMLERREGGAEAMAEALTRFKKAN